MAAILAVWFWSFSHAVGAGAMFVGWRTYRQRFYLWSAAGWLLMAFMTVDRTPTNIAIMVLASIFGLLAVVGSMFTLRRRVTTVVSLTGDAIRLRTGYLDVDVVNEGDRTTPIYPLGDD